MDSTQLITLRETLGNQPAKLNALELLLASHSRAVVIFWTAVWLTAAAIVLWKLWRAWRLAHR